MYVYYFYPLFNLNWSQLYKNGLLICQKKWQAIRTCFVNNPQIALAPERPWKNTLVRKD